MPKTLAREMERAGLPERQDLTEDLLKPDKVRELSGNVGNLESMNER